jgi:hypothetical protein
MSNKPNYLPGSRERGIQQLERLAQRFPTNPLIQQVLSPDLIEWLKNRPDENPDIFGRMRQAEADLHTLDELVDIVAILEGDVD